MQNCSNYLGDWSQCMIFHISHYERMTTMRIRICLGEAQILDEAAEYNKPDFNSLAEETRTRPLPGFDSLVVQGGDAHRGNSILYFHLHIIN